MLRIIRSTINWVVVVRKMEDGGREDGLESRSEDGLKSEIIWPYTTFNIQRSNGQKAGPPKIGEEAWSKIPKFRSICSDKFSKIFPNVFGLPQAFAKNFKFCSDGPSGLKKWQICSDQPIWPQKKLFFLFSRLLRTDKFKIKYQPPGFELTSFLYGTTFIICDESNYTICSD